MQQKHHRQVVAYPLGVVRKGRELKVEEDLTDKMLSENSKLEGTMQNVFTLVLKTRDDHGVRHYLAAAACKHTDSKPLYRP